MVYGTFCMFDLQTNHFQFITAACNVVGEVVEEGLELIGSAYEFFSE